MKTLNIYSSTKNFRQTQVQTESETWGGLKPKLSELGLLPSSYNAVDGETRQGFTNDEAILPDDGGDIWISAAKVKSGQASPTIYRHPKTGKFCSKEVFEAALNNGTEPGVRDVFEILNDLEAEIIDNPYEEVEDTSIEGLFEELVDALTANTAVEGVENETENEAPVNEEAKRFFQNL